MGCAPVQEQGKHFLVDDQVARDLHRDLGIELVVHGNQFNLLTIDATAGVDGIKVELGALGVFLDPSRHGSSEARRLTDAQLRPRR